MGAWLVGPRLGRFEAGQAKAIEGHNVESVALGTLLMWFGWCASLAASPAAQ
jgi:ammonium transporter, Amt family